MPYTMQFQNDVLSLPLQQTKTKGFVYKVYIYISSLNFSHFRQSSCACYSTDESGDAAVITTMA